MVSSQKSDTLHIDISVSSVLKVLIVVSLLLIISYIRELFVLSIVSVIFGLIIRYIAKILHFRYKIKLGVSILIVLCVLVTIIVIAIAGILPLLIAQGVAFWNFAQNYLISAKDVLENSGVFFPNTFSDNLSQALPNLGQSALGVAGLLGETLVYIFLVVVLSSYIALDFSGFQKMMVLFVPQQWKSQVPAFFERIEQSIGRWAVGHLFVSLTVGLFIYTLLLIFGIRYGLALSLIVVISGIIPLVGPLLGVLIITLVGLSQGTLWALMVCLMVLFVHMLRIWLLIPLFVDEQPDIDPLILLVTLMGAFILLGELGLFIVTPVLSLGYLIYDDIQSL